jgi:hypothetical protein
MSVAEVSNEVVLFDGLDYQFGIGSLVRPDGWDWNMPLLPSDWEAAKYRIESAKYAGVTKAVNIKITGRKIDYRGNKVRCQIEFVGDGEDSVFHGGYIYLS